jgi:hypothetical protein
MSQEAVERFLGRLVTDERFNRLAAESLEAACWREGYNLSPEELRLLSGSKLWRVAALAGLLDPGLCRAGGWFGRFGFFLLSILNVLLDSLLLRRETMSTPGRCGGKISSVISALLLIMILVGAMIPAVASADIASGQFGVSQVFYCDRSPAYPVPNSQFTLTNFNTPYADSRLVNLTFTLPDGPVIEYQGEITWLELSSERSPLGFGINFVLLPKGTKDAITNFLQTAV